MSTTPEPTALPAAEPWKLTEQQQTKLFPVELAEPMFPAEAVRRHEWIREQKIRAAEYAVERGIVAPVTEERAASSCAEAPADGEARLRDADTLVETLGHFAAASGPNETAVDGFKEMQAYVPVTILRSLLLAATHVRAALQARAAAPAPSPDEVRERLARVEFATEFGFDHARINEQWPFATPQLRSKLYRRADAILRAFTVTPKESSDGR